MDRSEAFYRVCDLEVVRKVTADVMSATRVLFTLCRGYSLSNLVVSTDDKGGEAVMDLAAEVLAFGMKLRQATDALSQMVESAVRDVTFNEVMERAGQHVPPGK